MDFPEFKKVTNDLDYDLLTDWEQGFLEGVEGAVKKGYELTKFQAEKLRQICEGSSDRHVKSSLWPDW